jgi:hypothetical protein
MRRNLAELGPSGACLPQAGDAPRNDATVSNFQFRVSHFGLQASTFFMVASRRSG